MRCWACRCKPWTILAVAERLEPGVIDHLGVGPVWAQTTKPDAAAPGGLRTLARIARRSPWPCVAIGGIDAARAGAVRPGAAVGVAVVSAICGQPDPAAAARGIRNAWEAAGVEPRLLLVGGAMFDADVRPVCGVWMFRGCTGADRCGCGCLAGVGRRVFRGRGSGRGGCG